MFSFNNPDSKPIMKRNSLIPLEQEVIAEQSSQDMGQGSGEDESMSESFKNIANENNDKFSDSEEGILIVYTCIYLYTFAYICIYL